MLKPLAGLDPKDYRRPQQGEFSVDFGSKRMDIAMATAGTTGGQRMHFKILQEVIHQKIEELGISEDVLKAIRALSQTPGLLIVSGRPGSGVTSTMYSVLREHDAFMKQLVTLEAKPAIPLENITQNAYGDPQRLPETLANALRRDPDVIMVDHCPDAQTAGLILQGAAEKSVILGLEAEDSFTALAKWAKLCGSANAAVEHLGGVLCQLLLRKLCTTCKEPYRPDPQMLAKANLPASIDKFFRPPTLQPVDEKGRPIICSACQGSGYFERTGVFELLLITPEIRQVVAAGANLRDIKSAARKAKMLYLQEQALRKVIAGVTSIQEVLRVSQPAKKA
jgi:type II secretory ATPase GspE/PulE/Tfp pilus assembly ATPase PilB-like protein